MAIRDLVKFDFFTTLPGIFQSTQNLSISGGKLLCNATSSTFAKLQYDSQGTWIVNLRINVQSVSTGFPLAGVFLLLDGATGQCGLLVKSTGKLQFYRGTTPSSGALIGPESTQSLAFDNDVTYYDLEAKVVLGNSGTVELKINGASAIASTTVDNTNTANGTADTVELISQGSGSFSTIRISQAIIADGTGATDNDFLGVKTLYTLRPSSSVTNTGITRSGTDSGSDHGQVDDTAPNDDTDALEGDLNAIYTLGYDDLPAGVTGVTAIARWWRAKRTDATLRGVSPVLRISGTDYIGTNQALGSTYQYFRECYGISPATSADFTASEVNAIAGGIKVTA